MNQEKVPSRGQMLIGLSLFIGFCAVMGILTNVFGSKPLETTQLLISAFCAVVAIFLYLYARRVE